MHVVLAPGPGNGQELFDSLLPLPGLRLHRITSQDELGDPDLIVTPRGPSRSFSAWYHEDPIGRALIAAHQRGTPWIALCGSGLPLVDRLGKNTHGIERLSLLAAEGHNDRLFGHSHVRTADGTRYPFHFTSAPAYVAHGDTETLAETDGMGSIVTSNDLVLSSGLPLSLEGWGFLFQAVGMPVAGPRLG